MHPVWKVLNFTSEFKHDNDIFLIMDDENYGNDGKILAQNMHTLTIKSFDQYCLVEPVGIDMGTGQLG